MEKTSKKVHAVTATINNFELTKAGSSTTLEIKANGKKLGTLEIGRGSLFWYGPGRSTKKRINWTKFADRMNVLAYGKP
jgi:hypothetical protein